MSRLDSYTQYLQDAMKSWSCPGLAVAVIRGEEVLHQGVYGMRDIENNLPMTADTRFAMASVTKSFAAMSIALLVDEGRLAWDKPVNEYMPDFVLDDEYITAHITVRDMLSHRTGLPRHDFAVWRLDITPAEFIKRMKHFKFSATFREKFQYNNLMYYAAAYLVEKVSGQPWETFVQTRIFEPLGMVASNFMPEPPRADQTTAWGYRADRDEKGGVKGLTRMPYGKHTQVSPGAAGALFSTLADLTKWLTVHVNSGTVGDFKLVSPDNLKLMHLPQMVIPGGGVNEALHGNTIFNYGMGWFVEPYRGNTLVHHGGNVEGFSLEIGFVPQENIGVIVLTNLQALPLRDAMLYESIDRVLDLPDRDWNQRYHAIFDPYFAALASGKQTAKQEQTPDAPPTHPLETYLGIYAADGYPDFAVRREGDSLLASTVGSLDWSPFRHYHYDVFEWHLSDFDEWLKVRFLTNDNGEIDTVSIPLEPAVDNIIFKRKPITLPEDLMAALLGKYTTPIAGWAYTVTRREGKLYITPTGGTPEEMQAYRLTDALVGLSAKRVRFEFARTDAAIPSLTIKMPDATLEATHTA